MLVLAGANAVSVVLLGTLCLLWLTGRVTAPAFVPCLVLIFVLATALWVRTERRHRTLEPLRRVGRIAVGLVVVLAATPMAVLTPLFWLEQQLPAEADVASALSPVMAAVLLALVLAILVNAAGGVVIAARALLRARGVPPPAGVS